MCRHNKACHLWVCPQAYEQAHRWIQVALAICVSLHWKFLCLYVLHPFVYNCKKTVYFYLPVKSCVHLGLCTSVYAFISVLMFFQLFIHLITGLLIWSQQIHYSLWPQRDLHFCSNQMIAIKGPKLRWVGGGRKGSLNLLLLCFSTSQSLNYALDTQHSSIWLLAMKHPARTPPDFNIKCSALKTLQNPWQFDLCLQITDSSLTHTAKLWGNRTGPTCFYLFNRGVWSAGISKWCFSWHGAKYYCLLIAAK